LTLLFFIGIKNELMELREKYFDLCYTRRIHEFYKIDLYKNWPSGTAKLKYRTLTEFYLAELQIGKDQFNQLQADFKKYNDLYSKYYNEDRKELFEIPEKLLDWYEGQKESCNYCGVTQAELHDIVESRGGKLTLNQKSKRSKGTLEIEKKNPSLGYTFSNVVLSCPFCNNAKSNLISEDDWRTYFVPAMKNYFNPKKGK
jgi:5-methylcytosine-specific restriction endonuclease McrA